MPGRGPQRLADRREVVATLALQVVVHILRCDGLVFHLSADSGPGVLGGQGAAAQFDPHLFAEAGLFRHLPGLGCLGDTQAAALGLGAQADQNLAECQRGVSIKAKALGDDGAPEREDGGAVDLKGLGLRWVFKNDGPL